jgi:hypothetical protein
VPPTWFVRRIGFENAMSQTFHFSFGAFLPLRNVREAGRRSKDRRKGWAAADDREVSYDDRVHTTYLIDSPSSAFGRGRI